jgi:hypothetical protein
MQNPSGEVLGDLDTSITKLNAEIDRMTPNMKAMDRHVCFDDLFWYADDPMLRLDDVESKLAETEKEAEKSRKDSKSARDAFSDVKQRRYGSFLRRIPMLNASFVVLNYSTKRTTTSRSASTRCIRILPRVRQPPWAASPISAWKTMRYG